MPYSLQGRQDFNHVPIFRQDFEWNDDQIGLFIRRAFGWSEADTGCNSVSLEYLLHAKLDYLHAFILLFRINDKY